MGLPSRRALERAWRASAPDLVHIATEGPLGWSALAAARKLGIPVATDFHTNFHAYSRHYGFAWLARAGARPTCAASTTAPTAPWCRPRELRRRARARTASATCASSAAASNAGGVLARQALARAARAAGAPDRDTPVALCVSRFAPEKNPAGDRGLRGDARGARRTCKLVLVGDGPLARGAASRRNVGYVIAGRLVNGELSAHYASADIFLFPSTTETFGNVTMEAMASGLGDRRLRLRRGARAPGDGARRCSRRSTTARRSSRSAVRLARDLPLARRLGAAARRAREPLTWDRIVGDFEAVLCAMSRIDSHALPSFVQRWDSALCVRLNRTLRYRGGAARASRRQLARRRHLLVLADARAAA